MIAFGPKLQLRLTRRSALRWVIASVVAVADLVGISHHRSQAPPPAPLTQGVCVDATGTSTDCRSQSAVASAQPCAAVSPIDQTVAFAMVNADPTLQGLERRAAQRSLCLAPVGLGP